MGGWATISAMNGRGTAWRPEGREASRRGWHNRDHRAQGTSRVEGAGVRSFTLVDLVSQAEYIPLEVRAWPRERILAWLAQNGEVWRTSFHLFPAHLDDGSSFFFRSWIGCETG